MTSREVVKRTVLFQNPSRLAYRLDEKRGSDFAHMGMNPFPDARPKSGGVDEWGVVWMTVGTTNLGQVKDFPLKRWEDFPELKIPDVNDPARWRDARTARERAGDKFLLANGISMYERVHFLRGLENIWADIYQAPDKLGRLIDVLADMNVAAIRPFAELGADGYIFCDDWGLQDRLMISPQAWRAIWKPRYARVYRAAHEAGLLTFLHSCGYIVEILDDLIEAGLDVIQMDQQENMGLESLSRFAGRITFWCPVDIQKTMVHGTPAEIRTYCRKLLGMLGTPRGGFIAAYYSDPVGTGHTQEAVDAMCDEFINLSKNYDEFWRSQGRQNA